MKITSDWHIHSQNSCDSACMTVADLVTEAIQVGICDYGLTDHVHTPYNLPDIDRSRREYIANHPSPRFHFGVEVSSVSQWELDRVTDGYGGNNPVYGIRTGGPANGALGIGISAQDIAAYGIEFVVGGTHWPMYVPFEREAVIRDYHRQNMFLATHPLVDIVAHPWWWMGHWQDSEGNFTAEPWFDDFEVIPRSMHDEFAAAAVEHHTAVEINISAILLNPHYPDAFVHQYLAYLVELQSRGVQLSIGSDCHLAHYNQINFEKSAALLESAGLVDDFWGLAPRI
ncbi:MAG: PHP domain-containing protein [Anaerolineae bacterium]|nr:PHP domain-containing protein [Anaerolineae bacterium]